MALLNVENLSVNYGYVSALKNISIEAHEGQIVSIIGSNGAGKSSLLRCISGLATASSGFISFQGKHLPRQAHKIVELGIVHVPEGRDTFSGLTVQDNLLVGGYRFKGKHLMEDLEKQYTQFPILRERKKQFAGTLSGGEQQMLAISRGLMAHPKLLLLDEPSLGLAPLIVNQVFAVIKTIRDSGITILLVEQNARKALSICDMAYVLENGEIKAKGQRRDLLSSDLVKEAYLGQ